METIYLDHNATTPAPPAVIEAVSRAMAAGYANPASQHQPGQAARKVLEDTRQRIAELLGANLSSPRGDRLLFTASATEANNLAILGMAAAWSKRQNPPPAEGALPLAEPRVCTTAPTPGQVIISSIEHQCAIEPAERLAESGWRLDTLPVDGNGVVKAAALEAFLRAEAAVVSVTLGNHDTGVLQPVAELAAICNARGVPLHTDAVQVVGKHPVSFRALGAAAMTVAAHKFGGPVGIGALVLRHDATVEPVLFGGHQQSGLRPGTESIPLAVGMATALEMAVAQQAEHARRLAGLRDRFEAALSAAIPGITVHGRGAVRLPQTSNIALPGIDGQVFLIALSLSGVACSVGSACSSGSTELSPTLLAMGLPRETSGRSLRFSFGATTTADEVDEAVRRIAYVWREVRA